MKSNGWVNFMENGTGNPRIASVKLDGTGIVTLESNGNPNSLAVASSPSQNASGTVQVWYDGTNLYISSNAVLLYGATPPNVGAPNLGFAISASGKYVAVVGPDGLDSKKAHLVVYQGS